MHALNCNNSFVTNHQFSLSAVILGSWEGAVRMLWCFAMTFADSAGIIRVVAHVRWQQSLFQVSGFLRRHGVEGYHEFAYVVGWIWLK